MSEFRGAVREAVRGWCVLTEADVVALERHYRLMVAWNQRLNLTRVTSLEFAVRKHYAESLFVAAQLPEGALRIVDVGSGAGFPGIPVAVLRRESSVTLVEAHQRKAVFLREVARDIRNCQVVGARAEGLDKHSFDWVVSRAVKWKDVLDCRLACRVALLMSAEDSAKARCHRGWNWSDPVVLPWDGSSVVQIGCFT